MKDFIFLYIRLCSSVLFKIQKEKNKSSYLLSGLSYRKIWLFQNLKNFFSPNMWQVI